MRSDDHSANLAKTLVVAAFKVALPNVSTRVEGLADIADIISQQSGSWRSRNSLRRRLEDATDLLTERLSAFEAIEFSNLPRAERELAVEGICQALEATNITRTQIIKQGLDFNRLYESLEPAARQYWRATLIGDTATQYGRRFLAEACRYLINLVHDLPEFAGDAALENLLLTQKIYDILESAIESVILPQRVSDDRAVDDFEANYRSRVIHYSKYMQLIGTELPLELAQQPIEIAYITLMAQSAPTPAYVSKELGDDAPNAMPGQDDYNNSQRVDSVIGKILAAIQSTNQPTLMEKRASVGDATKTRAGLRILLTGSAGSGKTTVGQWLATRSAEASFESPLRPLNQVIPFFVQLRTLFVDRTRSGPSDVDLMKFSRIESRRVPDRWIESTVADGRALLIFDGLDEISDDDSRTFYIWLERLLNECPKSHFVVTSRPQGLATTWFTARKFSLLDLQPMNLPDVRRCVDAWFRGVMETAQPSRRSYFRSRKEILLRELNNRAAIRELATTPLLAAMLCAFYANNVADAAPRTRRDLYKGVTDALIDLRDRGRRSLTSEQLGLDLEEKRSILQVIARYMMDDNISSILTRDITDLPWATELEQEWTGLSDRSAQDLVKECLTAMPLTRISAPKALKILLSRSIVFREVAPNESQFIHKSIQEYLAALEYFESDSINGLLAKVGFPLWENVLSFASGLLTRPSLSQLVAAILDNATNRRRILLAAECMASGKMIETDVAKRCREALRTILPPRSMSEAEVVSSGGEGVIAWLSSYDPENAEVAAACIRTAALVGGNAALELVARLSRGPWTDAIIDELLANWLAFDPKQYANLVLSNIDMHTATINLGAPGAVENVRYVSNVERVRLESGGWHGDFGVFEGLSLLQDIDAGSGDYFTSIKGCAALPALRRVNLAGNVSLREISAMKEVRHLQELHLVGCHRLVDIEQLAGMASLRVLNLDQCTQITDFDFIASLPSLWTLSLNYCNCDSLDFVSTLKDLRTLRCVGVGGVSDTGSLRHCQQLRRIELRLKSGNRKVLELPESGLLRILKLDGHAHSSDLAILAKVSSFVDICVDGFDGVADLGLLSKQSHLRHLAMRRSDSLTSCAGLENCKDLVGIDLSETLIEDINSLAKLTKLRRVVLNDCHQLRDLSPLAALPLLEYVEVQGVPFVDPVTLRRSSISGAALVVVHDPFTQAGQVSL